MKKPFFVVTLILFVTMSALAQQIGFCANLPGGLGVIGRGENFAARVTVEQGNIVIDDLDTFSLTEVSGAVFLIRPSELMDPYFGAELSATFYGVETSFDLRFLKLGAFAGVSANISESVSVYGEAVLSYYESGESPVISVFPRLGIAALFW